MRYEKRRSSKSLFTVSALFFTAIVILGLFRFQASRLEYMLNAINQSIERYSAEEVELRQVFSGLSSPIKIYSYCKDILGMDKAKNVEMVRVDTAPMVAVSAPEIQNGWRSGLFSFFGFTVN